MRRSSMRRGSAVLLTILPLLSPTYALPTYFGNDAAAIHSNVERAAVPEAAVALEGAESTKWLSKSKRQLSSGAQTLRTPTSITLDTDSESANEPESPYPDLPTIPNIASEGSDHWLGVAPREIEEREAKAEAEAKPIITLDPSYVPPTFDTGTLDVDPRNRRRTVAL
ncbi:MAG: hypothetical protein Q9207_002821 [Kuettlingeria erythrocarpa]